MKSEEIRKRYTGFFKSRRHAWIPSASLIPENDPTVLFTTAGMHPLVPYLMGEKHSLGKRLVNLQKCVRTCDIDEAGDQWHLTFFEMLGNWSLGDYFKKEAITMTLEFLTDKKSGLGLEKERIHASVFEGDNDAPKDEDAAKIWESLGIPKEHIHFYPKEENWWGPAGETGPCGPDSEIFYDTGQAHRGEGKCEPSCPCGRFVELGNNVFMQYGKTKEGRFEPLAQKNVDFGGGLERLSALMQKKNNAFETDLFEGIWNKVVDLAGGNVEGERVRSARIIADHLRAATFILGDEKGVVPSNTDQGYVLRRLIRRSVRHAKLLGIEGVFCAGIAEGTVKRFGSIYPELRRNKERILEEMDKEEKKFLDTIQKGTSIAEKEFEKAGGWKVPGKIAFDLYQSYGFPLEMTVEMAREKGLKVDEKEFDALLKEHQEKSRKGAEQRFKGGMADGSEQTTKLHTATHLLNEALRRVLGNHVFQKGSNITPERLRFDFPNPGKVSAEQLKEVEGMVNKAIQDGLEVKMSIMGLEEAKKLGAKGVFEQKYGKTVKVYTARNLKTGEVFSRELCGGPHAKNTKELGKFTILKEEGTGAGVRRIKAVLERQEKQKQKKEKKPKI